VSLLVVVLGSKRATQLASARASHASHKLL
jgi:hypothetical protein